MRLTNVNLQKIQSEYKVDEKTAKKYAEKANNLNELEWIFEENDIAKIDKSSNGDKLSPLENDAESSYVELDADFEDFNSKAGKNSKLNKTEKSSKNISAAASQAHSASTDKNINTAKAKNQTLNNAASSSARMSVSAKAPNSASAAAPKSASTAKASPKSPSSIGVSSKSVNASTSAGANTPDVAALEADLQISNTQLKELEGNKSATETDLNTQQNSYTETENQKNSELGKIDGDISSKQAELGSANQNVATAQNNVNTSQANANKAAKDMQSASSTADKKNAELNTRIGQTNQAQSKSDSANTKNKNAISAENQAQSRLNSANASLNSAISNTKSAQSAKASSAAKLTGAVSATRNAINVKNSKQAAVNSAQREYNSAKAAETKQKSLWQKTKDAVSSAVNKIKSAVTGLFNKLQQAITGLEAAQKDVDKKQQEEDKCRVLDEKTQAALEKREQQQEKAQNTADSAQVILDRKTGEREVSDQEYAEALIKLADAMSAQDSANSEYESALDKFMESKQYKADADGNLVNAQGELVSSQEVVAGLEEFVTGLNETRTQTEGAYNNTLNDITAVINDDTSKIVQLGTDISALQQEIAQKEQEIELAKQMAAEAAAKQAELEAQKASAGPADDIAALFGGAYKDDEKSLEAQKEALSKAIISGNPDDIANAYGKFYGDKEVVILDGQVVDPSLLSAEDAERCETTTVSELAKSGNTAVIKSQVKLEGEKAVKSEQVAEALTTGTFTMNGKEISMDSVTDVLMQQADKLEQDFDKAYNDQGIISKGLGCLNRLTSFGTTDTEARAQIEIYKANVEKLKNCKDPSEFAALYKGITGSNFDENSIVSLMAYSDMKSDKGGAAKTDNANAAPDSGKIDIGSYVNDLKECTGGDPELLSVTGNSMAAEKMSDYKHTQETVKDVGIGIATGVATAACVVAAPVTGGASIALGAAVCGASKVALEGIDTVGTSKKYTLEQGVLDFTTGAIEGTATAMTLGGAGLASKGFAALKGAGKAAASQTGKMTLKQAYQGFSKSMLNAGKTALITSTATYLKDTVGTTALYNATGNYTTAEKPSQVVQNDDGTYSVYYAVTDSNSGDQIYYRIQTVDSVSKDENGNIITGNVLNSSQSNDFKVGDLLEQQAVSLVSSTAGAAIGKFTGGFVNSNITNLTGSKAVGNAAEIAADTFLSLNADYYIADTQSLLKTGEHINKDDFYNWDRVLGEGRNQMRGLLIGLASSKLQSSIAAADTVAQSAIPKQNTADIEVIKTGGLESLKTDVVNPDLIKQGGADILKSDDIETANRETFSPYLAKPVDSEDTDTKTPKASSYSNKSRQELDEILQQKIDSEDFAMVSKDDFKDISDSKLAAAIEMMDRGMTASDVQSIVSKSDDSYERIKANIDKLADKCSDIDGYTIKELSDLPEPEFNKAINLLSEKVSASDTASILRDDYDYDTDEPALLATGAQKAQVAEYLIKQGISPNDVSYIISSVKTKNSDGSSTILTPENKAEIALKLFEQGVPSKRLGEILSNSITYKDGENVVISSAKEKAELAQNLLKSGANPETLHEILTPDEDFAAGTITATPAQKAEWAEKLLQSDIPADKISNIIGFCKSKQQVDNYLTLKQTDVQDRFVEEVSGFDEIKFQRFMDLKQNGTEDLNAKIIAQYTDEQYGTFGDMKKAGMDDLWALRISQAGDNATVNKLVSNLVNQGCSSTNAAKLLLLNGDFKNLSSESSLKDKMNIIKNFASFGDVEYAILDRNLGFDTRAKVNEIDNSILHVIKPTEVSKEDITSAFQNFFTNVKANKTDKLGTVERVIAEADFSKYGQNGIPLEYSRNDFVENLKTITKDLSPDEVNEVFKTLDITPVYDETGSIKGYDGIINLETAKSLVNSNKASDTIKSALESAEKFTTGNKVVIDDNPELSNALNSLIKGFPEFINVIGKQQHMGQELSVDSHIMKVLSEAMSNDGYSSLSNSDKTALKLAVLFHDIAKPEGVNDKTHPDYSARYTKDILEKVNLPVDIKDRVYELVKNHHWLENYATGVKNAANTSAEFRRAGDYDIAKIMAEADLKGVSAAKWEECKDALSSASLKSVQDSLDFINSQGQMIFTDKIITASKIPQVELDGKKYSVIDFTKITDDTDLSDYGFMNGTKASDLRLLLHMTDAEGMATFSKLQDVSQECLLCTSYTSLKDKKTFLDKKFGFSIETEMSNIANGTTYDQISGYGDSKNFTTFAKTIADSSNPNVSKDRSLVSNGVKTNLGLSDGEYADLFKQISGKKYITQISDEAVYTVGDKQIKGAEIKSAIRSASDALLVNASSGNSQSEINVYDPKINAVVAKVDSLDEVPEAIRQRALEFGVPIYILGSDE